MRDCFIKLNLVIVTASGTIRAAHNHIVRRVCRLSNAGNRKSNGLEFARCVRCCAESWFGFAICSCYSDGAMGWETRHVRSHRDVVRLRAWIALHFALFLGIGVLGVGVRRAIALAPGGHFSDQEQWIICVAVVGMILVIMGIAATSERHARRR